MNIRLRLINIFVYTMMYINVVYFSDYFLEITMTHRIAWRWSLYFLKFF